MIIILATVHITPGRIEQALEESHTHVARSLTEPGCLAHAVYQDHADPNTIVFVERWADKDAMRTHFGVPAARAFGALLAELAAEPPVMQIYEAEPLS